MVLICLCGCGGFGSGAVTLDSPCLSRECSQPSAPRPVNRALTGGRQSIRISTGRQLGGRRWFCLKPPLSAVRVLTSERLVAAAVLLIYEGSSRTEDSKKVQVRLASLTQIQI